MGNFIDIRLIRWLKSHAGTVTLTPEQINAIASQIPPTNISGKVDKVSGKGLSTNDYTDEEKQKLANLTGGGSPSGNYDGGKPDTNYGGITNINAGGVQ